MGTLLIILGVLFVSLVIIIPLVERFAKRYSAEELSKLTRWILPLLLLLMILQALRYFL
jgi:hypothetical protein